MKKIKILKIKKRQIITIIFRKKRRIYLITSTLIIGLNYQANALDIKKMWSSTKKLGKEALSFIPYGDTAKKLFNITTNSNSIESKINRIAATQLTGLEKITRIVRKAQNTEKKVEEMYYFKKMSQKIASSIAKQMKNNRKGKKNYIPKTNPAIYLPSSQRNEDLKKDYEEFFSKGYNKSSYIKGTKKQLAIELKNNKGGRNLILRYETAEKREEEIKESLQSKRTAQINFIKKEITRLKEEIINLEKEKTKESLTTADIMMIEMVIEQKRTKCFNLDNELTNRLEKSILTTEKEEEILSTALIFSQLKSLENHHKSFK
ncbi:MAG: hypothetical protein GY830_08550 [Bacteroidetes bacterium]|nr:hypothetical protein [Bacteroidota bacterium]